MMLQFGLFCISCPQIVSWAEKRVDVINDMADQGRAVIKQEGGGGVSGRPFFMDHNHNYFALRVKKVSF